MLLTIKLFIGKGNESDYRLLPLLIAMTLSVLYQTKNEVDSFGHAIAFALYPTELSSRRVIFAT